MKTFVENLIPRLKKFSESLDKIELFVEKPWILIDEQHNHQKYIFRRSGELVMSLNGMVTLGKWEYISAAKSLLIDRNSDKILLNQNFIDPSVMILKLDGTNGNNLILANQELLPTLNVNEYLKQLYYIKTNIVILKLKSGLELEVSNYEGEISRNMVTIEGNTVADAIFEHEIYNKKYVIRNSHVYKILTDQTYKTIQGIITIEQEQYNSHQIGDFVLLNNLPAPNAKYKLAFMSYIEVENGAITKISVF